MAGAKAGTAKRAPAAKRGPAGAGRKIRSTRVAPAPKPKPPKDENGSGPRARKRRTAYRALVDLNVGLGKREIGELVPEAHRWDSKIRNAMLGTEQLEKLETDEEPAELHEWIDPDRPALGTRDDPEAVEAWEREREELLDMGIDPDAKPEAQERPRNTADALHKAEGRRQRVIEADEAAAQEQARREEALTRR